MEAPQAFGLLFMIGCGLGSLGYIEQILQRWMMLRRAVSTEGIIRRFEQSEGGGESTSFWWLTPVAEFATAEGEMITFKFHRAFVEKYCPYKVGDTVPVLYDPNNPKNAVWAKGRYGGNLILGTTMCLLVTAFGAALYFYGRPPYLAQ